MPSSHPTRHRATSAFQPNPQQAAAIQHTHGPAAFIAAAGTGKTAILVQRLVRLVAEEKIDPAKILCVTFTRAAAHEMEKRAGQTLRALGTPATTIKQLRLTTFHGLGHLMLREHLGWTPRELNQKLLSGDPRQWLAEDILRSWSSNRQRGMNWSIDIAEVLRAVDRAKDAVQPPEDSASFFAGDLGIELEMAERFQEFYQRYEAAKKKEKRYDLADLIYVPLRTLRKSPTFRQLWQGRFDFLQVDETQDTNPSQYALIQYLAAPKHNVVVVGDPDQAIYQFRGASPEASILGFRDLYPQGKIYRIEHNYRSTPQILAAANRMIAQNPITPGFEKELKATLPDGPEVIVTAYPDQEREADGLADQIARIPTEYPQWSFKDCFVLSRTNQHLAALEFALARRRIPYRTVGGSSFFKRKTTRDMLAYLALVDGQRLAREEHAAREQGGWSAPHESADAIFSSVVCGEQNAAFRTVAHIPSQAYVAQTGKTSHRWPAAFYGTLASLAAGRPLLQFCEEQAYVIPAEAKLGILDFTNLIQQIAHACHNQPAEAIRLARALAYDTHLKHWDARQHDEAEDDDAESDATSATRLADEETAASGRFEELEELLIIAQRHHTIRHFLQAMAELKDQAESTRKQQQRDCVTLMTIHKSKGLEQQIVFVIGLTEGIFPHRRSFTLDEQGVNQPAGIAEERRLAYVAFTRARHVLALSTVLRYRGGDATPSRFIDEAGLTPVNAAGILDPFVARRPGMRRAARASLPADEADLPAASESVAQLTLDAASPASPSPAAPPGRPVPSDKLVAPTLFEIDVPAPPRRKRR